MQKTCSVIAAISVGLSASAVTAQDLSQDVTARGNEPFWLVDVAAGTLTLSRPDFDPIMLTVTNRQTDTDGSQVIAAAPSSPALRAVLRLDPTVCADTMADQTYPFSATLEFGGVVFSGCDGDPRDLLTAPELWTVTEIAGVPPVEGTEVEIGFTIQGGLFGSGGCNRLNSSYEITGEGLSIGPVASTMMACPEEVMAQERAFLDALDGIYAFDIAGDGALVLVGGEGPVIRAEPGG